MARFSEQSVRRVRDATDLVELAGEYTVLRRTGVDRMTGRCPLHDERTPSFTISPSKQLFKCFGCDAGGDALTLVQLKEGLGFPAAIELLARRGAIDLRYEDADPRAAGRRRRDARRAELLARAAAYYAAHLRSSRSPQAASAREYLTSRGVDDAIRDRFAIGLAPTETAMLEAAHAAGFTADECTDAGLVVRRRGGVQDRFAGRLTFPVCDLHGRVAGFGARALGDRRGPKYVNSPSTAAYRKSELLYGAHHARAAAAKARVVIAVEGYVDTLAMHQAGILNTVGLMGTAVTEQQITALKRLAPTVVLLLDGDEAGARAILRAGTTARRAGLQVLVAPLPGGDPADLLHNEGIAAMRDIVEQAYAFARFHVDAHLDRADLSSAEGKDRLVDELRPVFAEIPSSAVREELIECVAARLELPAALLRSWMPQPESHQPTCELSPRVETSASQHLGEERSLLERCISEPAVAGTLLGGRSIDELFADPLHRRVALHIRNHPTNAAEELPDDDAELVSFITGLLSAAPST